MMQNLQSFFTGKLHSKSFPDTTLIFHLPKFSNIIKRFDCQKCTRAFIGGLAMDTEESF